MTDGMLGRFGASNNLYQSLQGGLQQQGLDLQGQFCLPSLGELRKSTLESLERNKKERERLEALIEALKSPEAVQVLVLIGQLREGE